MNDPEMDRVEALRALCAEIFGRNNLIDTDFADVGAWKVEKEFMQDVSGVTIQFTISEHALGKLGRDASTDQELTLLLSGPERPGVEFMNELLWRSAENESPERKAKRDAIRRGFEQQQRQGG